MGILYFIFMYDKVIGLICCSVKYIFKLHINMNLMGSIILREQF